MTEPGSPEAREYATLFLARAILEGSLEMARAALDAGADPDARWIDGDTTLRDLASFRGRAEIHAHLARLPRTELAATLPTYRPLLNPSLARIWSREFVLFAAARGYGFAASDVHLRIPADGRGELSRVRKTAIKAIENRWRGLSRVAVEDGSRDDGGPRSAWTIDFLPEDNFPFGATSPSRLNFWVDESGWALFKKFDEKRPQPRHGSGATP